MIVLCLSDVFNIIGSFTGYKSTGIVGLRRHESLKPSVESVHVYTDKHNSSYCTYTLLPTLHTHEPSQWLQQKGHSKKNREHCTTSTKCGRIYIIEEASADQSEGREGEGGGGRQRYQYTGKGYMYTCLLPHAAEYDTGS